MSRDNLEAMMPNLRADGYEITSEPTIDYNCLGWAVYDDERWWSPPQPGLDLGDPLPTRFWPIDPPPPLERLMLDDAIAAYATLGYVEWYHLDLAR